MSSPSVPKPAAQAEKDLQGHLVEQGASFPGVPAQLFLVLPGLSKVKMSPSHLAALLGVLGSELQLERRRLFRFGETCSSVAESKSTRTGEKTLQHAEQNHPGRCQSLTNSNLEATLRGAQ